MTNQRSAILFSCHSFLFWLCAGDLCLASLHLDAANWGKKKTPNKIRPNKAKFLLKCFGYPQYSAFWPSCRTRAVVIVSSSCLHPAVPSGQREARPSSAPTLLSCWSPCRWCSQRWTLLKTPWWEPSHAARAVSGLWRRLQLMPLGSSVRILERSLDPTTAWAEEVAGQASELWEPQLSQLLHDPRPGGHWGRWPGHSWISASGCEARSLVGLHSLKSPAVLQFSKPPTSWWSPMRRGGYVPWKPFVPIRTGAAGGGSPRLCDGALPFLVAGPHVWPCPLSA